MSPAVLAMAHRPHEKIRSATRARSFGDFSLHIEGLPWSWSWGIIRNGTSKVCSE